MDDCHQKLQLVEIRLRSTTEGEETDITPYLLSLLKLNTITKLQVESDSLQKIDTEILRRFGGESSIGTSGNRRR